MTKNNYIEILKKNYPYVILFLFLVLGFYLRSYHLDFPSIGYHNMKEMDFLGQADNFVENGEWTHPRVYHWRGFKDPGYFEANAQMPFLSWYMAIFWTIFGKSVLIGRLTIVLFFLASIVLMYLVTKQLTKNEYLSLLSAFFFTIMPLGVFFGRNIQPEGPGLFFILLGIYYYLKWLEKLDNKMLLYSMLAISVSALFKATHLIILIPMLFIFPFKELKKKTWKKFLKKQVPYAVAGLGLFVLGILFIQSTYVEETYASEASSITTNWNLIFTSSYWDRNKPILRSYVLDNFTGWYFIFTIFGLLLTLLKVKTRFSKFALGYFLAFWIYFMLLPNKLNGHSYYQMPFLPLVAMMVAYFFFIFGDLLKQITSIEYTKFLPLLLILLTLSSLGAAMDRVWDTNFYGQEVGGEYIRTHTQPDDRFLNYGIAQSQAVCYYAQRRCGKLTEAEDFKEVEDKYNIRYIYVYGALFNEFQNTNMFTTYLKDNYDVVQIGGLISNNQIVPYYFILEKGGNFSLEKFNSIPPVQATTYTTKRSGQIEFYTIGG